jgi:alpha-L-fucosidase
MSDWFSGARFGMFIHWGHAASRGLELSWPLVGGMKALPRCQDLPVEEYQSSAMSFAPERNAPRIWMEHAKRAGMRYAVFTSRHHDGFSMFDTKLSDFSSAHAKYQGDIVREYVDAARAAGLKVGLYYSLSDWHHPDYPAFKDEHRPYRFGLEPKPTEEQWARYVEYMFGQVRELLTNYGRIDLIWFDGGWERRADAWRSLELEKMIRELQPGILINDRLPGVGDYDTPEQFVPAQPPARAWETCLTMNESWAYNPSDPDEKSKHELIHTLCEVASKGGNLLLNVSPMGDGGLPANQVERLDAIAAWMDRHADAIHDTTPGLEPWQFHGPTTRKGDRIFLHLLSRPYESVTVRGVPVRKVRAVRDLATRTPLEHRARCSVIDTMYNANPNGELTIRVPSNLIDEYATVIELEFEPDAI